MFKQLTIIVCMAFSLIATAHADLADPTRPPGVRSAPAPVKRVVQPKLRLQLSSILIAMDRKTAVINDQVVGLGDRINGATVTDIQNSFVRLKNRGRTITLVIPEKDIKTLSPGPTKQQGNQQ